jgi:hypothetical protein
MSQENTTQEENQKSKENRNKILLGALLVMLLGVVYYQFFSGGGETNSSTAVARATVRTSPSPTPQRQTSGTPVPIVSEPLAIASIEGESHSSGGTGRNIFVYPTPTTPPPTPTPTPIPSPTPWPIPVSSANPGNLIARTAGFTLTVFGEKIPQDAQGLISGRAYPTTFISASQVKINVPAEAIRMPGVIGVSVRSSSNEALVSNTISIPVAAPPEPPYKYVGLVTVKNTPTATLVTQGADEDVYNVKKGQVLGGRWKILNITPMKVELEDTSIKVSHTINYTSDAK